MPRLIGIMKFLNNKHRLCIEEWAYTEFSPG